MAPHNGPLAIAEDDPAHACFGCVDGLDDYRFVGDQFGDAGGPVAQVTGQALEVREVLADVLGDADAVAIGVLEAQL